MNRTKLWFILKCRGISPKMLRSLESMYNCVKGCVRVNNSTTDCFECPLGLRQGCVMSPFLFSMFINELALQVESSCYPGTQLHPDTIQIFLLLFADDIVLFADTILGLKKRINALETFCDEHNMVINLEKNKVIVFKKGGCLSRREKWFFKGEQLECVSFYKYLGIVFSKTLSWYSHVNNASAQAKKVHVVYLNHCTSYNRYHMCYSLKNFILK